MRQQNPHFEAIVQGCGYEKSDITRTLSGLIAKVAHELKDVGATPEEILRRCEAYRLKFAGFDLTPTALAKHWAGLKPPAESLWDRSVRIAREKGLEPFKGHPDESKQQFIDRVTAAEKKVVQLRLSQ